MLLLEACSGVSAAASLLGGEDKAALPQGWSERGTFKGLDTVPDAEGHTLQTCNDILDT